MKLIEFLDDWLENSHKEYVKHQTYVRYKSNIDCYLRHSDIGQMELNEVTRKDVQSFVNGMKQLKGRRTGKPLSAGTINNTFIVLQSAYGYAEDYGMIDKNPCCRIRRAVSKAAETGVKCFTVAEQKKIESYIDNLKDPEYYCYLLDFYTGLRIGELCALTWDDVDFETKTLYVNKTVYSSVDDNGSWELMTDTPKTRTSVRSIPLPAHVVKILARMWKSSKSSFVCSRVNGERITPWVCRWRFDEMLKKTGVRHLNFHCIRHTFATRALENGIDVKTLAELLGHSSPAVTLNVYTHSLSDHKRSMMDKMQRV